MVNINEEINIGGTYRNDRAVYQGSSEVNTKTIACFGVVRFSEIAYFLSYSENTVS